jgi:ribosomal RNA-processing protein 7
VIISLSRLTLGYLTHHKLTYPDHATLQSLVDTALTRFNAAESARMVSLKRLRSEPDEDGFITVTRREKEEVVVEKKNRAVNLDDFYRFQKREKREKRMDELRRKFEEDKVKVERAKEGRKFKPF